MQGISLGYPTTPPMKYTLQIALAIALGLSLHTVAQMMISWKVFDRISDIFQEITTPRNLPRAPPLTPAPTVQPPTKEWRAIAERTKEWNRIYRPSPKCQQKNQTWDQMVECANEYIRGRQAFDNRLENKAK